jgi:hypothetical protein
MGQWEPGTSCQTKPVSFLFAHLLSNLPIEKIELLSKTPWPTNRADHPITWRTMEPARKTSHLIPAHW